MVDLRFEPAHTPEPKLINMAEPTYSAKNGDINIFFRIIF
jgi:hypothetical protein